ncbi:MAG: hypothetical protein RLZZ579_1166 [Actinomycetota bacterium]
MFAKSWALERGSALALGLIWLTLGLTLISALGLGLKLAQIQLQGRYLADSAALMAADVSRGLLPGYPCPKAGELVLGGGARLTGCRIVGDGVVVEVRSEYLIWSFESRAKAGAP